MNMRSQWLHVGVGALAAGGLILGLSSGTPAAPSSASFTLHVLAPVGPEAPEELRLFATPVKADSSGQVISGQTGDPVKNIVGAQAAGNRGGLARFTKILFGAEYNTGRPNPSHRLEPSTLIPALVSTAVQSTSARTSTYGQAFCQKW